MLLQYSSRTRTLNVTPLVICQFKLCPVSLHVSEKTCGEKFARRSEWYGVLTAMFLKTQVLWDVTLCPSRVVSNVSKTFKTSKGTCPTTEHGIPKDWHFQQRNFPSCLLPAQPDNLLSVTQCCFTVGGIWNKNRSFNQFSDKVGV
jgi:hypothetical protein